MSIFREDEIDAFKYAWEKLAEHIVKENMFHKYPPLHFKTPSGRIIEVTYDHLDISRPQVWSVKMKNVGDSTIYDISILMSHELKNIFEAVLVNHDSDNKDDLLEFSCRGVRNDYTNATQVRTAIFNAMRMIYATFVPDPGDEATYVDNNFIVACPSKETIDARENLPKDFKIASAEAKKNVIPLAVVFIDIYNHDRQIAIDELKAITRGYLAYKALHNTFDFKIVAEVIYTNDPDSLMWYEDIKNADLVIYHRASCNWATSYSNKLKKPMCAFETLCNVESNCGAYMGSISDVFAKKTKANMEKS